MRKYRIFDIFICTPKKKKKSHTKKEKGQLKYDLTWGVGVLKISQKA